MLQGKPLLSGNPARKPLPTGAHRCGFHNGQEGARSTTRYTSAPVAARCSVSSPLQHVVQVGQRGQPPSRCLAKRQPGQRPASSHHTRLCRQSWGRAPPAAGHTQQTQLLAQDFTAHWNVAHRTRGRNIGPSININRARTLQTTEHVSLSPGAAPGPALSAVSWVGALGARGPSLSGPWRGQESAPQRSPGEAGPG